ncbi:MAG: response regulator [Dehalococcoidia bacterium]
MTDNRRAGKILVVDDDPNLTRSVTFILQKEGYLVDTATNGEEAMEKIRNLKPRLIYLDVMMPKKNGYEVCQEIKTDINLNDVYVIMLTAKGQERDREKGMDMGADEFITKPFSPKFIVERTKAILG